MDRRTALKTAAVSALSLGFGKIAFGDKPFESAADIEAETPITVNQDLVLQNGHNRVDYFNNRIAKYKEYEEFLEKNPNLKRIFEDFAEQICNQFDDFPFTKQQIVQWLALGDMFVWKPSTHSCLGVFNPHITYRIETTKGKVIEFQVSSDGPNYGVLADIDAKAEFAIYAPNVRSLTLGRSLIRVTPERCIHLRLPQFKINEHWPSVHNHQGCYGTSLVKYYYSRPDAFQDLSKEWNFVNAFRQAMVIETIISILELNLNLKRARNTIVQWKELERREITN